MLRKARRQADSCYSSAASVRTAAAWMTASSREEKRRARSVEREPSACRVAGG